MDSTTQLDLTHKFAVLEFDESEDNLYLFGGSGCALVAGLLYWCFWVKFLGYGGCIIGSMNLPYDRKLSFLSV